jgi:glycosyltransferase involved in cell wall biosynthesis
MAAMMARALRGPVIADAVCGPVIGDALCQARAVPRRQVLLVVEQLRRAVPGGIGTYVRGLLQGLHQLGSGTEPPSVSLFASRAPAGADPLRAFGHPVAVSSLPAPVLTRMWARGMADVPGGFDVVHATSLASPPARHSPLVVTVHDLAFRALPEAFPGRGRRWHERMWRRALARAAALVVPSAVVADAVVAAGADARAVHVIAHGSDHLPPPDDAAADAVLARLGMTGPFVLSVGTLEPRKNLPRLVTAYAKAASRWEEQVALLVVGPTGWGSGVAGATGGVHFAGPVEDGVLSALYARARAVAFVPLLEGFGLPVLEAMAAGAAVVASPVPSLAGVDGAAVVVDPTDETSMADGLLRVVTDAGLRAELVEAGRRHAAGSTWARSAAAHVRLWESVS